MEDLRYLSHAPLGTEIFKEVWWSDVPAAWALLLGNKVYFPSSFLTRHTLDERIAHIEDLEDSGIDIWDLFVNNMFTHPRVSEGYIKDRIFEYGFLVHRPDTGKNLLSIFLKHHTSPPVLVAAASHEKAPLPLSASVLLENWELFQKPIYDSNRRTAEEKVDSYLRQHGWDNETLVAVPLKMKLGITK